MPEVEAGKYGLEKQGTIFMPFDNQLQGEHLIHVKSKHVPTEGDREHEPYADEPLPRSEFDLPNGPLLRFQAYTVAWNKCLGKIKDIIRILQTPVVDAITQAVHNAYIESPNDVVLPLSELVTLLVSSSDRAYLHDLLAHVGRALREEDDFGPEDESDDSRVPGAFISHLSQSDCQSVMSLIQALILGFISQPLGMKPTKKIKPSLSRASYDMSLLSAWYQKVQACYRTDIPALVVLIPDLHTIDPTVLSDLFEICSLHLSHLPLIFVLGSSDPNHLHSALPHSTLACLRIERYILPLDLEAVERIIMETFFSPNFTPNVMLGPVGFEMVFEEFKRHNATLDALLSTLQLLHLQHFYNPLSFIVDASYDTVLSEAPNAPPEEWQPFFQLLRQHCILSLQNTQEEKDESEWSEVTPQRVVRAVVEVRGEFRTHMSRLKIAIHILGAILRFLRGHGKKGPDLPFDKMGLEALRGTLGQKQARGVCNLIRRLNPDETLALLAELYHLLHNLPSSVRNLASEFKQKVVLVRHEIHEETTPPFVDFLIDYFKQTMIPFEDTDCLDVWWTGETSIPHSPFNPNPHMSIVTALLEPQEYLGWSDFIKTTHRQELSTLPDTCILFRRYVESGKMINIYDWYNSFAAALGEDSIDVDIDETPSKSKRKGKETATPKRKRTGHEEERKREIQARFLRSMHELELVGFLKRTGRKKDHVVKTVFDVLD